MNLTGQHIRHINSITHDGKIVLFGTGLDGIYYSVKRSGFEDTALQEGADLFGFEPWEKLRLGDSVDDPSVTAREKETLVDSSGKQLLRSVYGARVEDRATPYAPVQVLSVLGHLYVFRASFTCKILVSRFVLDGMTNKLVPKLEVRFARSKQRYAPKKSLSTDAGATFDNLNYRDVDGNAFYEPSLELTFAGTEALWFAPLFVPTSESDRYRWHIFVVDSDRLVHYSIGADASGNFDVKDYFYGTPDTANPKKTTYRCISGIIRRTIDLQGMKIIGSPSVTTYDLQKEQITDAGPQLTRDVTRAMLAIPVKINGQDQPKTAVIDYAIAVDGTLSQIDLTPDESRILRSNVHDVVTPLSLLDDIKEMAQATPAPGGTIVATERGKDDLLAVRSKSTLSANVDAGSNVKIRGTRSYDGHYTVASVDGATFQVQAAFDHDEAGFWEVVPKKQTGLVFDDMVIGTEKTADGRLKILCPAHDLRVGDEVQISGTRDYNGVFPIKSVDKVSKAFVVDTPFFTGEAGNLSKVVRRGLRMNGDDWVATPDLKLATPNHRQDFERTLSAWVRVDAHRGAEQVIIEDRGQLALLSISDENKVCATVCVNGWPLRAIDPEELPLNTWVHFSAAISYSTTKAGEVRVSLCRNGVEVASQTMSKTLPSHLGEKLIDFTGDGSHVEVPAFTNPANGMTVSAWVNNPDTTWTGDGCLVSKRDAFILHPIKGSREIRFYVWTTGDFGCVSCIPDDIEGWHLYTATFDGQTLRIYVDGALAGAASLAGAVAQDTGAMFIGLDDGWERYFRGNIASVELWDRARTQAEIVQSRSKRRSGTEPGLVGYWPLDNGTTQDLSRSKRHAKLGGGAQWREVTHALPQPLLSQWNADPELPTAESAHIIGRKFSGEIADVQIWSVARSANDVKKTMHVKLTGKEQGLEANYRLGAVSYEQKPPSVADFSYHQRNGIVHGDPYAGARRLGRATQSGMKVVKYGSDELVAVSQRGLYEETFEFKVTSPNAWFDPSNADGTGQKLFTFSYWGKSSRGSDQIVEFPLDDVRQSEFSRLEDGWYKATCRVIVPDGISLMRAFEISEVKGKWSSESTPPDDEWTAIDVRKHHIRLLSDTVTCDKYTDVVKLDELVDPSRTVVKDIVAVRTAESKVSQLELKIRDLLQRLGVLENRKEYEAELTTVVTRLSNLQSSFIAAATELDRVQSSQWSYYLEFEVKFTGYLMTFSEEAKIITQRSKLEASKKGLQQWQAIEDGNGTFKLKCRKSGMFLEVPNGGGRKSYPALCESATKEHQKWKLTLCRDDYYYLSAGHNNDLVADVDTANRDDGRGIWLWEKNGAENQIWKILSTGDYTPEAQIAVETLTAAIDNAVAEGRRLADYQTWLEGVLASKDDKNALESALTSARSDLHTARAELSTQNAIALNSLGAAAPMPMPALATDTRHLVTSGAVLDFARPTGGLKLTESCEGNVLLNYFDTRGRMRSTRYDVAADSRNATFEQWLPEGERACAEIRNSNSIKLQESIVLPGSGWTCEAWVHYPLASADDGEAIPMNIVASAKGKNYAPLAIRRSKRLGMLLDGWFFDSGADLERLLAIGNHHIAVSVSHETALFYADGVQLGARPVRQPVLGFNGSTDYVEVPAHDNPTSAMTISIWARSTHPNWNNNGCLVGKPNAFMLHPWLGQKKVSFSVNVDGVGASVEYTLADIQGWHLYTGTFDGTAVRFYVDGVLVGQSHAQGTITADPGVMTIGHDARNDPTTGNFGGDIAEVSYWNVARSSAEIREDYYRSFKGNEPGLIGYWRMEKMSEGNVVKVKDLSSGKNHGRVHGDPKERTISANQGTSVDILGNDASGAGPIGRLAEVRLWNQALTDAEIAVNATTLLSGNEPGLIAYWPLNEATGQTAHDRSAGGKAQGTLSGVEYVAWTANLGNPGSRVLNLANGTSAYIECPTVNLASSSFTIECWARRSGTTGKYQYLVAMGAAFANSGLHFGFRDSDQFTMDFWGNRVDSHEHYTDTSWHHWCATYDKSSKKQSLYCDGELIATNKASADFKGTGTLYLGRRFPNDEEFFTGDIAEVRIWNTPRAQFEILDTMRRRLSGTEVGLVAYYPLDGSNEKGFVKDVRSGSFVGKLMGGAKVVMSTDVPLAGSGCEQLISNEYSTVEVGPNGAKQAIMRRFQAFVSARNVELLPEQRVEELTLQWVGNTQIKPTLLGYIEGAPPVPSENLTEAVDDGYKGATSVTLKQTEGTTYSWQRAQSSSYDTNMDVFGGVSWGVAVTAMEIFCVNMTSGKAGGIYKTSGSERSSQSTNVTASSSVASSDRLELRGTFEDRPMSNTLGKRWVPKNVGYAVVISGMADVFVTKLKRSGRPVSYDIRPVEGVPLDINTITFMINPAYVMNGSLDGLVGSMAADPTFYPHVPAMRAQYGSLYPASYFQLKEAYALKESIQRQDKDRESFFYNFDANMVENIDRPGFDVSSVSIVDTKSIGKTTNAADSTNASDAMAKDLKADSDKRVADIEAKSKTVEGQLRAKAAFADWQLRMAKIQTKAAKRNIVNTYVWDGDGGLHAEEESFAGTIEHCISGEKSDSSTKGGMFSIVAGPYASDFSLVKTTADTGSVGKTLNESKALELGVDLSGVESDGITDLQDRPLKPGEKVDRYRFMTFYLEGSTDHFADFFDYVVDPEWLQSNDEEARALRMAQSKSNKCWRVLHRVTYVERPALMNFGRDSGPRNS